MAISRFIIRAASFDRGIKVFKMPGRFGLTVDGETLTFDSVEDARKFADSLNRALDLHYFEERGVDRRL